MNPNDVMYQIISQKERIDQIYERLNPSERFFEPISLEMPRFSPSELGLIRAVSWFYIHYQEAGKVNVNFLREQLPNFSPDGNENLVAHVKLINDLRTYFQHNLDLNESRDRGMREYCENWFKQQCGVYSPIEDEDWLKCLVALLDEALAFFKALHNCIRKIREDEAREQILEQWRFQRKRFHPPHSFDKLIEISSSDMGRNDLDVKKFRDRYYQKWINQLQLLNGNYNFEVEARGLIEDALLNEGLRRIPINGNDIITGLGIEPGKEIGRLLELARNFFNENPKLTKEQLLDKLRS